MSDDKASERRRNAAVDELRETYAEGVADAVATAQRIADRAVERGFGPEILEGTGDAVYDFVTQQLLTTTRVLRHAQGIAEKLLEATLVNRDLVSGRPSIELLGAGGELRLHVRNDLTVSGDLDVHAFVTRAGATKRVEANHVRVRCGRKRLAPGQETVVRIELLNVDPPEGGDSAVAGYVDVMLNGDDRQRRIARQRFELWL